MRELPALLLDAIVIGAGATAIADLWALFRQRIFGAPSFDYAMLGRWLGHMPRGRFRHDAIIAAAPIRGERPLGWAVHYAIGVLFAGMLLGLCGPEWARSPTPAPAILFGLVTVAAPFFVMQPGLGAGIAASRTPQPNAARLRSVVTHLVFGLGLYLAAEAWRHAAP